MTSNYAALQDEMSHVLCGPIPPFAVSVDAFRQFVSNTDIKRFVGEIRHAITADNSLMRRLAAKSYQHENGFAKLTILENPSDRFRLRLHWWHSVNPDSDSANIHNHRFNCASHVLHGRLRDVTWRTDEAGISCVHHRYYPRLDSEEYKLSYVGSTRLSVNSVTEYGKGDTYAIRQDTLHTSQHLEANTITLFLEERSILQDYADVFSRRYPPRDLSIISPGMQGDSFVDTLSSLVGFVSQHC